MLAAKVGFAFPGRGAMERGGSPRWIKAAVEASLRRLGTEYIDLYQLHRPDYTTSIEETLGAFDDLIRAGKIRAAGASMYPAELITEAQWVAERRAALGSVASCRRDPAPGQRHTVRRLQGDEQWWAHSLFLPNDWVMPTGVQDDMIVIMQWNSLSIPGNPAQGPDAGISIFNQGGSDAHIVIDAWAVGAPSPSATNGGNQY